MAPETKVGLHAPRKLMGKPPPRQRGGRDLTRGPIWSTLLVFSLPIIAQMSLQPVFGFLDGIFIAQVGPRAFKAVVNASLFQMLIITMAAGLANGVTSYVARLVGAGDYEEADNAAQHAMLIMLVFSGFVILLFRLTEIPFYRFLELEPELYARAHSYIGILVYGNLSIMFNLVGANILRAEGNSMTPLLIAAVTVGLNLVLAPILIFGKGDALFGLRVGIFGLDVFGGGLATFLARTAGCLMLIGYLLAGRSVWTFSLKNFKWNPRHLLEILRVGFPMLLVNFSSWVASLVFLKVLNPYPGAVVAYGMGTRLDMLAVLPVIGLMVGVLSMTGQNYGAGKLARAEKTAWTGGLYGLGFSLALALAFKLFAPFWVSLFNKTNDPEIARLGLEYINIVALTYPLVSLVFVLGGAFQGLGKGMPPLAITLFRFLAVAVPLVLILTPRLGGEGAWWAVAASHLAGGLVAFFWLQREFKKRRREAACKAEESVVKNKDL